MKSELIRRRAAFLADIRRFFAARNVLEVDTNLLRPYGVTDSQLTSLRADDGYLITSPEYAMKTLLCQGAPDIYQLSHVFRGEESGRRHLREFMLLEWYRHGYSLDTLIAETTELIRTLLSNWQLTVRESSYAELFAETFTLDIFRADSHTLRDLCRQYLPESAEWALSKDAALDLLFTHFIEPNLGKSCVHIVRDYPPSQAALAQLTVDDNGRAVAARFEAYVAGVELCNGFAELGNATEQAERFAEDNRERRALGLAEMAVDVDFLAALRQGLPPCAGVAVGVDRLFMLACGASDIHQVILG